MSYSRDYHTSVTVSGSKTVTVGDKSQTVYYSETVPIDIRINVLTEPFDRSVSNCNTSINVLTGSVVAMNGAQCAAINETTKEVSKSVIDGFFGTIRMELEQQTAELDSRIKAGFGLLMEQGKAVTAQKGTMETDYNRISSRYAALFEDLDKECHKRIYALDKNVFEIAGKVSDALIYNSLRDGAAKNILLSGDGNNSNQMMLISRINKKSREVLLTLLDYITQELRLNALTGSFLHDEALSERQGLSIPVLWTECDDVAGTGELCEVFMQSFMGGAEKAAIGSRVNDYFLSPDAQWKKLEGDGAKQIDKEFSALCEDAFDASSTPEDMRVYEAMKKLWADGELLTA